MRFRPTVAIVLAGICSGGLVAAPAHAAEGDLSTTTTVSHDQLDELVRLVQGQPDRYGGVAVDRAAGTVRVYVRQDERAAALPAIRQRLHRAPVARDQATTAAGRLDVVPVRRSLRELDGIMQAVGATETWSSSTRDTVSEWYVNPATNRVRVGLTRVTPQARAEAARVFGDGVELVQQARHQTMARRTAIAGGQPGTGAAPQRRASAGDRAASAQEPTRLLDAPPYYGGTRIYRTEVRDGQNYLIECTAAFTVLRATLGGTTALMSTAGHCGPTGVAWTQGYLNRGTGQVFYTGPMGTMQTVRWGNNQMDAAVIGGGRYYRGAVYGGRLDTTAWGVRGQRAVAAGQVVCSNGSFTRQVCGAEIQAVNACLNLDDNNGTIVRVCNQAISYSTAGTGRIVQHGDSGGPVIEETDDPSGYDAVGIISGGEPEVGRRMNFTQFTAFSTAFGVTVAIGNPV